MIETTSKNQDIMLNENFKNQIINCCIRVPTGDNCQPFKVQFEHNELRIYYNNQIGKHILNFKDRSSLISYGCIKRIIDIVCSHHNLMPYFFEYMHEYTAKSHWATVKFQYQKRTAHPFLNEIQIRTTNRGKYEELDDYSARKIETHLNDHFTLIRPSTQQSDMILDNDKFLWKNPKAVKDLLKLTNFIINKKRGFNYNNLYISYMHLPALLSMKYLPFLGKIFWPIIKKVNKKTIHGSSLLIYTRECHSSKDYILMGEDCYENWLQMTRLGFSMQPISTSSLCINDLLESTDKKDFMFKILLDRKSSMKNIFQLDKDITWSFRIGRPVKNNIMSERISIKEFTNPGHLSYSDLTKL